MYTLFVILIVIAALLMIGIVLIQESKGGGLSSNFQGANVVAGVRKTTDIVEKTTWGLAIAMVVISVACAYVAPKATVNGNQVIETTGQKAGTNANNVQGFGAAPAAQNAEAAAPAAQEAPAQGAEAPAAEAPQAK